MRANSILAIRVALWVIIGVTQIPSAHAQDVGSVADALTERIAAHDRSRDVQQQINALRGTGPGRAERLNDQALATELATAREQLRQANARSAELNARLDAQRQTRAGLVPLLRQMLDLLEHSIQVDLPFDTDARLQRIAAARDALTDASYSATEQLERVLEIYQQELRLNYTTQITPSVIDTRDGERAVRVIRLGRIALYTLNDDLQNCAVYQLAQRQWQSLSVGTCRQLAALVDRPEQAPLDGLPLSVSPTQ